MFKISLLIAGFFAAAAVADAQQIKGVVTDSNGDPLVGVSVFVDGTTLGVSTDVDGQYTIDIPDARGKTLVFSCIGMATKEIIIGQNTNIDITLEDDTNFLDETVVIGYATVRRRDLLGSVTSVSSDAIAAVPVTTVGEALTGKMAGVQVTTTEGDPDAEIKIRVRGTGSITQDSSPLYIVDGFPVESISDIAASDIQSIDVLKDAFSTAIYGSRGANGVVLVTTKSGGAGKVSVSYDAYYGLKTMANKKAIQPMDPYEFVRSQYELASLRDAVNENYIDVFGQFQDMDLYQNMQGNDWIQQVFGRTGETFNHNLTVSGRSDKVSWTASYNHINDKAIMLGSDYHRDNLRFKTRYKPIKQLTFDLNMRYSYTKIMGSGSNSMNDTGTTSGNGRLKHAVQYTPIPLDVAASGADMEENYGDNAPPIQSVADNDNRRIRQSWNTNASVTWHIIDNLDLKVEGGLETYSQTNDRFYGITTYYVANNVSEGYENQPAAIYTALDRKTIRNTNTLTYNFKDVIKELEKGSEFETIVLDLYEDFYEFCRQYMYDKLKITHESDQAFSAWDKVRSEFFSTMKGLFSLPYNFILISQEDKSRDITNKSGDKITAIKPNINDKVAVKTEGLTTFTARVIKESDNKRWISFKTDDVVFGGGRIKVDAVDIPCTYEAVMGVLNSGKSVETVAKTTEYIPERDGKAVLKTDAEPETAVAVETAGPAEESKPKKRGRKTKAETPVATPADEKTVEELTGVEETVDCSDDTPEEEQPVRRKRRKRTTNDDAPF